MARASDAVNVSALIDRRLGPYQIWIIAICFVIAFIDGLDTQAIGVTGPLIAADLHLAPGSLGPIFAASQWGALIGAFLFGPCADRWGRRRFLFTTCALFSLLTLATAWATSFESLLVLRALTGLGIGGARPCFVALASEYAPRRLRAGMVTVVWGAVPGGGILAGLFGAYLLSDFDWRSVYYASGALSLVVCVLMVAQLPESISFMVARGADPRRIRRILSRIAPGAVDPAASRFFLTEEIKSGVPVQHLFNEGRALSTILLWIGFFIGFLVLIATLVWTPGLLKMSGMTVAQASLALVANNIGGIVGTIGVGQLIDRFGCAP